MRAQPFDPRSCLVGCWVDQFVEIRPARTQQVIHRFGPLLFVDHVRVIHVLAHFVLEEPSQLPIHQRFARIVAQPIVPQQFDPALHPAPAVVGIAELDRNVVGHVPGLHCPNLSEGRLQLRDPVRQLDHLKIFSVLLQIVRPNPKRIGN